LKAGWVIAGSILLVIFGVASVLLSSINNGVSEELTTTGYTWLAISVFLSLLGIIFIIVGIASKDSTHPVPPLQQYCCKICGAGVSPNQRYCPQCGRQLEWH